jgi:uncharacterized damage-inducible protein DinB
MDAIALCSELATTEKFFLNTIACFEESDSTFAPQADMYTVAASVAHVARTVDWFIEGAFHRADGFDMDFTTHIAEAKQVTSLLAAKSWLARSFVQAAGTITANAGRLAQPLPQGIMAGLPRAAMVGGIVDHTAHHRGALAVYARLIAKTPAMPYV